MAAEENSTTATALPASRRLPLIPALVLYIGAAVALAFAIGAVVALLRLVPGLVLSSVALTGADVLDAVTLNVVGTAWLLPITLAGILVGGVISRTEDLSPQLGMISVTVGAAVGAVAATQLMPPPDIPSHDLAAWAVLAPAIGLLLAVLPWPGALVHPDGGADRAGQLDADADPRRLAEASRHEPA